MTYPWRNFILRRWMRRSRAGTYSVNNLIMSRRRSATDVRVAWRIRAGGEANRRQGLIMVINSRINSGINLRRADSRREIDFSSLLDDPRRCSPLLQVVYKFNDWHYISYRGWAWDVNLLYDANIFNPSTIRTYVWRKIQRAHRCEFAPSIFAD